MQLHQLKPLHQPKEKKRLGRGGKKGTYCGRGVKGQKSRSGRKLKPIIREILKKYPKLRGVGFKKNFLAYLSAVINVETLEKNFEPGEKVTPQVLVEKKIIRKIKGKIPKVKILGRGEITKALTVEGCLFSKKAKEKIEKAGGKII